ncbi:MAG: hypothetical protein GEU96_05955 [Propionibacteriales bacterium]|nr:hypothetical protein [Propionibacteriales bacterium]
MDLVAYLGTVTAICGLAVGAMYVIVGLLGKRFDDVNSRFDDVQLRFDDMQHRIDDRFNDVGRRFNDVGRRFDDMDRRFGRIETQHDTILAAVTNLGQRVTVIEQHDR